MTEATQIVDVANLIESRKIGWFQFVVIGWACAIMFIEGYDMQVVPFAAPAIIKAWHVNKAYFGPVFGFGLFGYMLGATLLSNLGDKFGRKNYCGRRTVVRRVYSGGRVQRHSHAIAGAAIYRGCGPGRVDP